MIGFNALFHCYLSADVVHVNIKWQQTLLNPKSCADKHFHYIKKFSSAELGHILYCKKGKWEGHMWLADLAYEKHDVTYATPLFFIHVHQTAASAH